MLKMLLLIQIYSAEGYYFRNYTVLVHNEHECHELGRKFLDAQVSFAEKALKLKVNQANYSCTDAVVELDFWPIPDHPPLPYEVSE